MKKSTLILIGLVLVKFILQYSVIAPVYELHRDEFLHLDQGRHIAWGFVSVPPLTSWFAWLVFRLGGGEFWVKFFSCVVWRIDNGVYLEDCRRTEREVVRMCHRCHCGYAFCNPPIKHTISTKLI